MDRIKLKALASELAKGIKTEDDLNALSSALLKLTVETALNAELTEHLGYDKHGDSQPAKGNSRNQWHDIQALKKLTRPSANRDATRPRRQL